MLIFRNRLGNRFQKSEPALQTSFGKARQLVIEKPTPIPNANAGGTFFSGIVWKILSYTIKNVEFQSLTPMVFFDRLYKRFRNPRTRRGFFNIFSRFSDHVE